MNIAATPKFVELLDGGQVIGVEVERVHYGVNGIVFIKIEGSVDDTDRTLGGGIKEEFVGESLIDCGHRHRISTELVDGRQGDGVVLQSGVNLVHHSLSSDEHFVDEDAALDFLRLFVQLENCDDQHDGDAADHK